MNGLLIAPIALPLGAAVVSVTVRRHLIVQRVLSFLAVAAGVLMPGLVLLVRGLHGEIAVVHLGGWSAPLGIVLVADALSSAMVVITGLIGLASIVYSYSGVDGRRLGLFHPLVTLLLAGVSGAFLTGDLFNLYVWFEVILIASFGLIVLGGSALELGAAVKYAALNIVPTTVLLIAVALVYGMTGTLNMADVARALPGLEDRTAPRVVFLLMLVAFGSKAAIFPLFFWLPASYPTPSVPVSALFAGLLTKVGVYSMYRVFLIVLPQELAELRWVVGSVAAATMVVGVLGALAQDEIRRILSFHIISQIGYMVMGIALLTAAGAVGGIFYVLHHIIVKTNLFLIGGIAGRVSGSTELDKMGGLLRSHPGLAALFVIPAASLAGVPPLSGFWAKLLLVKSGLDIEAYVLVALALVVGLLTLLSMSKIWQKAFWSAPRKQRPEPRSNWVLYLPVTALSGLTVAIGLYAEVLGRIAERAAVQLFDPASYIDAVLGTTMAIGDGGTP